MVISSTRKSPSSNVYNDYLQNAQGFKKFGHREYCLKFFFEVCLPFILKLIRRIFLSVYMITKFPGMVLFDICLVKFCQYHSVHFSTCIHFLHFLHSKET